MFRRSRNCSVWTSHEPGVGRELQPARFVKLIFIIMFFMTMTNDHDHNSWELQPARFVSLIIIFTIMVVMTMTMTVMVMAENFNQPGFIITITFIVIGFFISNCTIIPFLFLLTGYFILILLVAGKCSVENESEQDFHHRDGSVQGGQGSGENWLIWSVQGGQRSCKYKYK